MTLRIFLLFVLLLASARVSRAAPPALSDEAFFSQIRFIQSVAANRPPATTEATPASAYLDKKTIENKVLALLAGSGVSPSFAQAAIEDPRTKVIPEIVRAMNAPNEAMPYQRYRQLFLTPGNIKEGADFYRANLSLLNQVQARYGVDPLILVSLIGVETHWGRNTGSFPVISALLTLASAFPSLSDWACEEMADYLKICAASGRDPHSILGSYAGAFGYYQFMPSSYNAYAVDFDGDGQKSWDQWPDVLASVANYLIIRGGYKPGPDESPGSPVWQSLYSYNHSDDYVKVILEMRREIAAQLGLKTS